MSEKVRIGIIGTSWWADLMHLPTLKSHDGAEVVAICGRNQTRTERMAQKYEIPQVFTDYRDMLERGELEALIISAPDDWHYHMAMDALDAGLHVLCEKPMALNLNQAQRMLEKAEAAGVKNMVLYTFRWAPQSLYLNQLIEEGYIGRCYQGQFCRFDSMGLNARYNWKFNPKRANGSLGYLGSDMIDLARCYMGDIVKVSAQLGSFVNRPGPEGDPEESANDSAILLLEFASGAQGIVQVSAVAHVADRGQEHRIILHGQNGTLEADFMFGGADTGAVIRGVRSNDSHFSPLPIPDELWGEDVNRANPLDIFTKQSAGDRLFIDAILNDLPITPNFSDGIEVQKVIEAAVRSHEEGGWISIS